MKTLILHIGTPKTATTALQIFFKQNRAALKKLGIFYPQESDQQLQRARKHGISSGNGYEIAKYLRSGSNEYQKYFSCFQETLKNNQCQKVLYSGEGFWSLDKSWQQLSTEASSKGYTCKVVVYLRDLKNYFIASYIQKIKSPTSYVGSIFDYYEAFYPKLNYLDKLNNLESQFGSQNLIVKKYPPDNNNIYCDFLRTLEIDNQQLFTFPNQHVNVTPNPYEIELLKNTNYVNSSGHFQHRLSRLKQQLNKYDFFDNKKVVLPTNLANKIDESWQEMISVINKKYQVDLQKEVVSNANNVLEINKTPEMSPYEKILCRIVYSLHQDIKKQEDRAQKTRKTIINLQNQNAKLRKNITISSVILALIIIITNLILLYILTIK
ncbi:hypothetical protein [Candidatus Uabimicrobium sp. HlEnr_7]|uniref:hypothetical protein n=1 Tax=Candidatus Uabimicrobium helgolandensis TaxID=3095367 RepID=UPI0035584B28